MPRPFVPGLLLLGLAPLVACNDADFFRVAGYQQESFSNRSDILFVIDNSASMSDESQALAVSFDSFINELADAADDFTTDGLHDAVGNYIDFVSNRSAFIDYQLGITTTDVPAHGGGLRGSPDFLIKGDPDLVGDFDANLLCHAACITDNIPSDPTYQCGDPLGDQVTRQYLDCACGTQFPENCAEIGDEEGFEAVFLAMCRAVDNPPPDCFVDSPITEADIGSNEGFIRENSTIIPVIVTDEGDDSRRLASNDPAIDDYLELFAEFPNRLSFAVIGPGHPQCQVGVTSWGQARYKAMVEATGGMFINIAEPDATGTCRTVSFGDALEQLGGLLRSLLDAFPLQAVPDVDTIVVVIDNEPVDRAVQVEGSDGVLTWSDGWSYRQADNTVVLHGSAIPDYNADVRVYYLPAQGTPRDLPF